MKSALAPVRTENRSSQASTESPAGEDRLSRVTGEAIDSPVHRLQQTLVEAFPPPGEARWSPRSTILFLLVTNGLFWTGLVLGLRAVL